MKYFKSIIAYISGLITFLFVAFMVIFISFSFGQYKFDPFIKKLARLVLKAFFIKIRVEGIENVDPTKSYIFTSNHVNIFDVFILNGYIPNLARGVELDSHFKWPIWGAVIKKFGNITISHTNPKSARQSLEKAKNALAKGISILILPEGHRTRDGNLRQFMKGPFFLAEKAQADIVPAAIIGAYNIKQANSLLIQPGTITFKLGKVLTYDSYKHLNNGELRDHVKKITASLIQEN